ncbi:hypothetical protein TeGR_g4820, partial [Tetraparma gracilis]
ILRKSSLGDHLTNYYYQSMDPITRTEFPGYLSPLRERRLEKLQLQRRKGKGPPKKGMGNRASKKK